VLRTELQASLAGQAAGQQRSDPRGAWPRTPVMWGGEHEPEFSKLRT